jgi:hypothetical protein
MAEVVLELVCGHLRGDPGQRCGELWQRWEADTDRPFDEYTCRAPDGTPYIKGMPPPGGVVTHEWNRFTFVCPAGCPSHVQVRVGKFETAATTALRYLYDTGAPPLRTTVDKLLKFAS